MLLPTGMNGVPVRRSPVLPMLVQEVSDNQVIRPEDSGCYRKVTANTFAQDFPPVSSLDEGWIFWWGNQGTGNVTVRPSNGDLIDGLTTYISYPEEIRCFYTVLRTGVLVMESFVVNGFVLTMTVSGTFVKAPGYIAFEGLLWGGGGSGAKNASRGGSGGGGGACVPFSIASSSFGASETITIGVASAGASAADAPGIVGNNSTIGSLLTAYGGGPGLNSGGNAGGGTGGGAFSVGLLGGAATTAVGGGPSTATGLGNPGFGGAGSTSAAAGSDAYYGGAAGGGTAAGVASAGGQSQYGGGGGGAGVSGVGGAGGGSKFGGAGGAGGAAAGTSGVDGTAPGGGGGGTFSGAKAGDGGRGQLRILGRF